MQAGLCVCKWVYSASEIVYTQIGRKLREKSNYTDTHVRHKTVHIHSQSTQHCNIA